jgi:Zn-finger nucleic acid-binding protein
MVKFRLICPDCDAVIITSSPEAMIWEQCPHCRNHIWDSGDILMAELKTGSGERNIRLAERFLSN